MRVGFLVWNRFQVGHFAPLIAQFDRPDVIFTNRQPSALNGFDPQWLTKYGAYSRFVLETELHMLDGQYDVILSQYTPPLKMPWVATKLVMTQYSMAKPKTAYNGRWLAADAGLVYGNYSAKILSQMCPVVSAGNPRFDPFFDGTLDANGMSQLKALLDPSKKTVLFLPTWGDLSSAQNFQETLDDLAQTYNVIYKPHHITTANTDGDELQHSMLVDPSRATDLLDNGPHLMALADVVVSDMSGAIFDALYCKRPVVLMGLDINFTAHAKAEPTALEIAQTQRIGPVVLNAYQLADTIAKTLDGPQLYTDVNAALVAETFTQQGGCAALAAERLTRLINTPPFHHDLQAYAAPVIRPLMLNKAYQNALKRKNQNIALAKQQKENAESPFKSMLHTVIQKLPMSALNSLANLSDKAGQVRVARYLKARHDNARLSSSSKTVNPNDLIAFQKLPRKPAAKIALLNQLKQQGAFFYHGYAVDSWAGKSAYSGYQVLYQFYCAASNLRFSRDKFQSLRSKFLTAQEDRFFYTPSVRQNVLRDLGLISRAMNASSMSNVAVTAKLEKASSLLGPVQPYLDYASENEAILDISNQNVCAPDGSWHQLSAVTGPILELGVMLGFGRAVSLEGYDNRKAMIDTTRQIIDIAHSLDYYILPRLQAGHAGAVPISGKFPSITWHTTDTGVPGQMHLKVGSFSEYIILDQRGYSGWSTIASRSLNDIIADVDLDIARTHFKYLQQTLVETGRSKYAQSDDAAPNVSKYVFLPMQVTTDAVAQLAYIDGLTLLQHAISWAVDSDYTLVVKRHPKCSSIDVKIALDEAADAGDIVLSNASVHTLINGADAVLTVNSGVGAEALLYSKPVITTGGADYAAATVVARTTEALRHALENLSTHPIKQEEIMAFLWVFTKAYQVSPCDHEALNAHIIDQLAQGQADFTNKSSAASLVSSAPS